MKLLLFIDPEWSEIGPRTLATLIVGPFKNGACWAAGGHLADAGQEVVGRGREEEEAWGQRNLDATLEMHGTPTTMVIGVSTGGGGGGGWCRIHLDSVTTTPCWLPKLIPKSNFCTHLRGNFPISQTLIPIDLLFIQVPWGRRMTGLFVQC